MVVFRGRVSARRPTYFPLFRHRYAGRRKVGKAKATRMSATLRFAAGNLRRGGCGVRCGTRCVHFVNSAQTTAASQITKQSCPSAGLQPRNHHAAGADIRGVCPGLRFARPLV
ncbi:hypothetical protein CTI10_025950 [Delftia acidovorans]|nr:hypothetical protein CTI10_025950 [Delftia acidovorans]